MKQRLYLETTIPSFLVAKPSRDLITLARQEVTRDWWRRRRNDFDIWISQFVIDEAAMGDAGMATRRLRVIAPFRQLQSTAAVRELTRVFLAKQILPRSAANDAAHIAIAAVHELDYILTWNLAHIANGEILKRVVAACAEQGYHCPIVCTPDELMGM